MKRIVVSTLIGLLTLALSGTCLAQAAKKSVETKTEPFVMVETLDARVESKNMTPIEINAKSWTAFKVKDVAPQGTAVKKGDVVLRFDDTDIQTKLKESRYDLSIARIDFSSMESDMQLFDATFQLDQELAEREWQQIQDDTKYYFDVQRDLRERSTKRSLENSQYSVEYAQEELDQLLQMYNEDELTEESEKLVLKRAERSLDSSKFYLENAEINTKHELEVEMPRADRDKRSALERAELEHQKKTLEFPRMKEKKELDFAKQRFMLEKKQRDFEELERDAMWMAVEAPVDGVVYHGQCRRGVWSKGGTGPSRIVEVGDSVVVNTPVLTIVDLKNMQLRCDIDQRQMMLLKEGAECKVIFNEQSGISVTGKITEIGRIPLDDGKFDCLIGLGEMPAGIVPGMNCKVKIVAYSNPNAILVPKTAVFTDDGGLTQYVYMDKDAGPEKRLVVALRSAGESLEVTDGLKAGEKILASKPE